MQCNVIDRVEKLRVTPYIKGELKRWNKHIDNHKKRIDGAKATIDKKGGKAFELLDKFHNRSQYQSDQKRLSIHKDNAKILEKLDEIDDRDDEQTRNYRYFEKRKPERPWENKSSSTSFMNAVRESEKKEISEQKTKLDGCINGKRTQRERSRSMPQVVPLGDLPKPPPSCDSPALSTSSIRKEKEKANRMKTKTLPVKLGRYRRPWHKKEVPPAEPSVKSEKGKLPEITKGTGGTGTQTKESKRKENVEKDIVPKLPDLLADVRNGADIVIDCDDVEEVDAHIDGLPEIVNNNNNNNDWALEDVDCPLKTSADATAFTPMDDLLDFFNVSSSNDDGSSGDDDVVDGGNADDILSKFLTIQSQVSSADERRDVLRGGQDVDIDRRGIYGDTDTDTSDSDVSDETLRK